jgi:transcriptional regulator with XRE-family HTH domain
MAKKSTTPSPYLKALGKRIKQLRIKAGYTSHETFAFENEINRVSMWRAESGYDIRFSTLVKIIIALNVEVSTFFSEGFGADEPTNSNRKRG